VNFAMGISNEIKLVGFFFSLFVFKTEHHDCCCCCYI